jgi:hypothetical protein
MLSRTIFNYFYFFLKYLASPTVYYLHTVIKKTLTYQKDVVRYKKEKQNNNKKLLKTTNKNKRKKSWQSSSHTHMFFFAYFFFTRYFLNKCNKN